MKQMTIYISGKITGLDWQDAFDKFCQAEKIIEGWGCRPVSPMRNGLPKKAPWTIHMIRDIELLMGCQAIYLLPDWRDSQGARIEEFIARELGLAVFQHTQC
jgi:hypothetical protein